MSYNPEPDSHIIDKVKVVLDLSNYSTKSELGHVIDVHTSGLAAKKDFIALNSKVGKLDISKLVNIRTTIPVIIFWEFLMFYQILLSPPVKRSVIISNKYNIYKLP